MKESSFSELNSSRSINQSFDSAIENNEIFSGLLWESWRCRVTYQEIISYKKSDDLPITEMAVRMKDKL